MIFKSLKINNITLKNRVAIGPMCQYSANEGHPTDWHFSHLQKLSQLGSGLLILESTFPYQDAKISKNDLVLSNNSEKNNFIKLIDHIHKFSDVPLGFQINHAGRKGSSHVPWHKFNSPLKKNEASWKTYAPSPIKRGASWPKPKELDIHDIKKIKKKMIRSSLLADQVGFDLLELHSAHGYLLHQFFSPITNKRNDQYGGSLIKRSRLILEIAEEIRKLWPQEKILGARVTADDCLKNGISMKDCIYLINELKNIGFDYITPCSGGIIPFTNKRIKPNYQVKYCAQIKKEVNIKVYANGMIRKKSEIENILNNNYADFVAICKPFINNPYWLFKIAKKNNVKLKIPKQYSKCFDI